MPRYFTYCFNRYGVEEIEGLAGKPLRSLWGSRFGSISVGDVVYVVSLSQGKLCLLCRIVVGKVDLQHRWLTGSKATPVVFDRIVPLVVAKAIRCRSRGERLPLRFAARGVLDSQTLRGVRELTPESATMLDRLIDRPVTGENKKQKLATKSRMRALSVRQPWAELILRGRKTIEVRSRPTNVRERVLIYASPVRLDAAFESRLADRFEIAIDPLARGVLVGSVEIADCRPFQRRDFEAACVSPERAESYYGWQLAYPRREKVLRKPKFRPQPVWFYPF